jgi:hypothetical protein
MPTLPAMSDGVCVYDAIYSTRHTLRRLQREPRFRYVADARVLSDAGTMVVRPLWTSSDLREQSLRDDPGKAYVRSCWSTVDRRHRDPVVGDE